VIRGIYLAMEKWPCHADLISFFREAASLTGAAKFTETLNSDYWKPFDLALGSTLIKK